MLDFIDAGITWHGDHSMNRLGNIATLLALAGLAAAGPAFGQTFRSDKADFRLDTVAEGL